MCLGIPGRIVEMIDPDRHLAKVDVSGVRRTINIGLISPDEIRIGDWVLIHVGFALSKIDEAEARHSIELLEALGEEYQDELDQIRGSRIE